MPTMMITAPITIAAKLASPNNSLVNNNVRENIKNINKYRSANPIPILNPIIIHFVFMRVNFIFNFFDSLPNVPN